MQRARRIAIDGPAGSGKSTVGEQLAARLGYLYLDTGAMYRAVTWLALREGLDLHNASALADLARHADIQITRPHVKDGRQYTVTIQGHNDITWALRDAAVTSAVSTVSAHPEVRAVLIAQQRTMAEAGRVVMVGRDIGAVVLPDAELKIYLSASSQERGRRRYAELLSRMGADNPGFPTLATVQQDIERRDEIDKQNMQPAPDAIFLDTDRLTVPQVLDTICRYLEESL